MPAFSSQSSPQLRPLTFVIPALLLLACSVPSSAWPWSAAGQTLPMHSARETRLVETADLFPTWADWTDGRRVMVPGVYHTRRTRVDARTGRPVEIELALAEPRLVHSHRVPGEHPPRIALTFDDGPSATYTPQLLDIFAEHGARCTLFTLGRLVGSHKQILRRAEQQGNEIAIHSWWHASYTGLSNAEIRADIARCRAALEGVAEQPVRWLRPPYGNADARVRQVINDAGLRVAMWSVDPLDWRNPGSDVVARHILANARDGAVVVLHDGGGNRAGTVAAMRRVVPELKERGFELVTLSELTGLAEPPPVERGMRLTIADQVFDVRADFDDVKVTVDGVEVELAEPPVMIDDQFLANARPVLDRLGAPVRWDPETLAVAFPGVRGEFVVKLNSLDVRLAGDRLLVKTPSIYYHGAAMLPVWLMANACGRTVRWDADTRTIEFTSGPRADRRPRVEESLMTLHRPDGTRVCWWPRSSLLSRLPGGEEFAAL
ncbi:MAG: polysaccharide deacetylase family protein [Armatimonadota bacterium]